MDAQTRKQKELDSAAKWHAVAVLRDYRWRRGYGYHHGPWTCQICGEHGKIEAGYADWPAQCGCEREVRDRAAWEFANQKRGEWVAKALETAEFPSRLADCTFDNFHQRTGTDSAVAQCRKYAEQFTPGTDVGLWLIGTFGSGKTHLAVATARVLIDRLLVDVRFVSAANLIASVRGDGNDRKWDWGAADRAVSAELLVLDDVGQEQPTQFSRDVLFRVISGRYEEQRPTILTSNGADAQLEERLGGAAVSRLYEMTEAVVLTAADYRPEILRARRHPQTRGKAALNH